ncbi:MAG TPA: hypothetical protein VGS97_10225 [Actinocrinis sp.]|uniref:hypothetical protein n=1 Tax=Actinocrinis sp. TaxID=1920516 RepID=UPI002DDD297B|nr:hypothetical protein [Actinocrinis sp.]HEV2344456.1 hypothetical protein [Actinocrinis sp.]
MSKSTVNTCAMPRLVALARRLPAVCKAIARLGVTPPTGPGHPEQEGLPCPIKRSLDALFCSDVETGDTSTEPEVAAAIRRALRKYRDWNGCTRVVAAAFANAPTSANERERYCRCLVAEAFANADLQMAPEYGDDSLLKLIQADE